MPRWAFAWLGDKVIVSCSPNVWEFTDRQPTARWPRKKPLFTKTGRQQHDHGAHAFVFGPDGKLYWNFGNEGHSVHDKPASRSSIWKATK